MDAWANDPIWQATRENVERLTGVRDWAEAFFATAVVFEPLVGELFRSGFVMQAAALQGDFVTPMLMGAGEADTARDQRGARALFRMLADDEKHGAAEQGDDAGLAERVDAGEPGGRRADAADLVPALREGRPLRGFARALRGALRRDPLTT